MLYCLLMERQRRNGLNLIMLQLSLSGNPQQHWVSDTSVGLPCTHSLWLMASLLSTLLQQGSFIPSSAQSHWHFHLLSPHRGVWRYQSAAATPRVALIQPLSPCAPRSSVIGSRLWAADKVNPVNMARDKATAKGMTTTKVAHRVQGMEEHALFIFCALGSAAIPHVSKLIPPQL